MVTMTRRADRLAEAVAPFFAFFDGPFARYNLDPRLANFAVGNPQEMPLPGYVEALSRAIVPRNKDWFAYKLSEPRSRIAVAKTLTARTGLDWEPRDVAMTNGGFGALAVAMRTVVSDPGDEVIFLSPPWFFYEMLILAVDGEPVRIRLDPPDFELEADEIARAITPRTRAVLINSPHNPSGRIYGLERLRALADVLGEASAQYGAPIYVISDEPYNRIVFDGRAFHSPSEVYPYTLTTYSYGKTLLAPGNRIGYITWPPTMPDRERLRHVIEVNQFASGYAFPNADLQHAIEDLEQLSIDIAAMQRRRDRLVPALREIGYETTMPEGTFYVMAKAPIDDDVAFTDTLTRHGVLVLPGTIVEVPGWFRISLTASDDMVERGIPGFRAAFEEASRR
jgi:aspartate aminotransferase